MTRGRLVWVVVVLLFLAGLAVLLPGSPAYLPTWVHLTDHNGRSTRSWIKALDSANVKERREAIFNLGVIGNDAVEAVPALADILREDPDRDVRNQAALALSKMNPASKEAVPALAGALADEELFVRMNAAVALLRLREEARPALPAMIEALADKKNQTNLAMFPATIQVTVALGLGPASAGDDRAVGALTAVLGPDSSMPLRRAAAKSLGEVGAKAHLALPRLRRLLADSDPTVRAAAEKAVEKIVGKRDGTRSQAPAGKCPLARGLLPEIPGREFLAANHWRASLFCRVCSSV